jgi:hypothetical protein
MPKKATTKKPASKKPAPAPAPEPKKEEVPKKEPAPKKASVTEDAPLALRLAVLEDVVRRASQETRAFSTKLETFGAYQTELARRVADVEKRAAR